MLAGCGPARTNSGFSPFQTTLIQENIELLDIIELSDLRESAEGRSILNIDEFLDEAGVEIKGTGDRAFVRGYDLIEACGPDCNTNYGFGEVLTDFVVRKHPDDN